MILLKDRSFPGIVRSSKKQGHCKPIIFLLTILLTLLLASCKNPWMEAWRLLSFPQWKQKKDIPWPTL